MSLSTTFASGDVIPSAWANSVGSYINSLVSVYDPATHSITAPMSAIANSSATTIRDLANSRGLLLFFTQSGESGLLLWDGTALQFLQSSSNCLLATAGSADELVFALSGTLLRLTIGSAAGTKLYTLWIGGTF
jgi:hypothetical protein